ncbi:MAG: hypothetical protein GF344_15335 [Chitinivibrionales bacterium]|nr:hypothetical protein [Chitinivibrionales bacterium]MBD3358079.1 hypothetical protein [Chitinivibrionales bacterium]
MFTVAGTVIDSMWADQSWRRFWAWDPKENGALPITLWCGAIFHARSNRMIRETGTAVGVIIGPFLVILAWVGVNLLGIGLHSSRFTSQGAQSLLIVGVFELLFLAIFVPLGLRRERS